MSLQFEKRAPRHSLSYYDPVDTLRKLQLCRKEQRTP